MKQAFTSFYTLLLFSGMVFLNSCNNTSGKADLIVLNGTIWTANEKQPKAQAMAIAGDTIMAVGATEAIEKYKHKNTEVLDLRGRFITPGFIDTHVHLIGGGNSLMSVKLNGVNTKEEFVKRIADYTNTIENGTWILEGNWDHTLWGGELPQKDWIDPYTADNPVLVFRMDGHMALANTAALELAGVDKNTADVPGGEIVRDENGEPTGMLKDNALGLVSKMIPPSPASQQLSAFKEAMGYFAANGVTSVHDVDGMSSGSYATALKLIDANELTVRVYAIRPLHDWEKSKDVDQTDTPWLKTGGLKGFVDGSLGSHTAAFHEPYTDKASDSGLFVNSHENLYQWISAADKVNLQAAVHAIGDRAIQTLLNIFERVAKENGEKDRRFRIEHAQHIAPEDIRRFADLGVIASMQPYHAIDDGRWAEAMIGPERIKTTYAFKSLIEEGATVTFGSDWPVAPATPLEGIYAAVTRSTLDDKNPDGWVPEQKITVEQALLAYTKKAAYASFEETIKGTLEPGKLADFVVFDKDLTAIEPQQIRAVKVLKTYVAGKMVFDVDKGP